MATIYRHRRASDNKVFYIGYTKFNYENTQSSGRPWNKKNRTKAWKQIAKYHGCEVDILISGITTKKALQVEVGLIEYYGRVDLKTGTLINFTNGGECNTGWVMTEEQKVKQQASLEKYRNNLTDERKKEISDNAIRRGKARGITKEHKKAVMKAQKEKVFTPEYRKKLSEAAKQRHKNMSTKDKDALNKKQSEVIKLRRKWKRDMGIPHNLATKCPWKPNSEHTTEPKHIWWSSLQMRYYN